MTLILLHSPKGGVGNTFLAAQLALHLAARGHDVSALDFTFQDSLKMHFGFMPAQAVPELVETHAEALVAAGVSLTQGHALTRMPAFRQRMARGHDLPFDQDRITIVDLASDDRELLHALLPHCALHICTLLPTAASLAVLPRIGGETAVMHLERTAFVLNQLDDRQRLSRHSHSFMRDLFGEQLIATVRRDEAVNEALARFEPISKYAGTSAVIPDLEALARAVEARLGLALGQDLPGLAAQGGR